MSQKVKFNNEELKSIRIGTGQLFCGYGYSMDIPLRFLGVHGFYCLIEWLNYRVILQSANFVDGGILDTMHCQSLIDGTTKTLYNFVSS